MPKKRFLRALVKACLAIGITVVVVLGALRALSGCADAGGGGNGDNGSVFIIEGTWQPLGGPDLLGDFAASGAEPRVFFYAAKKANVVWTGAPDGYSVESNSFDGASWAGDVERDYTNIVSPEPRIFSNGFNISFAVWRRPYECEAQVFAARINEAGWADEMDWEELSSMCGAGGDDLDGLHDIAFQIGEGEVAFAVWQDDLADVYASRHASGWSARTAISDIGGDDPRIAVDESGNAMVIWRDLEYQDLRGNYYSGGSWRSQANEYEISASAVYISGEKIDADLAVGPDGKFVAVWRATTGRIYASLFNGSWSAQSEVSTGTSNQLTHVTFTPPGDVFVVWENGPNILAARYPAGADWQEGWQGPFTISPTPVGDGWYDPEIGADLGGNVFFIWAGQRVYARRYPDGADWPTWATSDDNTAILDDSGWHEKPYVAVDANGRAIVVWVRFSGSTEIRSKRYFE
jgi:hypothetical protein